MVPKPSTCCLNLKLKKCLNTWGTKSISSGMRLLIIKGQESLRAWSKAEINMAKQDTMVTEKQRIKSTRVTIKKSSALAWICALHSWSCVQVWAPRQYSAKPFTYQHMHGSLHLALWSLGPLRWAPDFEPSSLLAVVSENWMWIWQPLEGSTCKTMVGTPLETCGSYHSYCLCSHAHACCLWAWTCHLSVPWRR